MQPARARSYWDGLGQSFAKLGSPLRPSTEDIQLLEEIVENWSALHPGEPLQGLLLGVTPGIAAMRWPERSWLMAVDSSLPMARTVWPGNVVGRRAVVCGNWLCLPRKGSSCHVVIGDGSINCLTYPDGFRSFAEAVRDVLDDRGLLVMRSYVQSIPREKPDAVYAHACHDSIGSFHAFKLRLLMSLQGNPEQGIAVKKAYESWMTRNLDPQSLPSRAGWEKADIETIEAYQDSSTVYAFPTLAQLRSVLLEFFEEVSISTHGYEMGDRCPTLVLRTCRNPSGNF